ncbi:MAG: HAMP domain-containing protein [Anaerolineae bacterium]|nr:HAMP domain-containing protein [Anaerolineae bacterium]
MTRSLTGKLILAFLLVAVTSVVIMAVVIPRTTERQFNTLVNDQQRALMEAMLIDYYRTNGNLVGFGYYVTANPPEQRNFQLGTDIRGQQNRRNSVVVVDDSDHIIVPMPPDLRMNTVVQPGVVAEGYPVVVGATRIATIIMPSNPPELTMQERAFLTGTNQALLVAALGALLVALVVGTALARGLTRPLRALTQAVEGVVDGSTQTEVAVTSNDELGELAHSFNQMSQRVAHADALRRQMTADIAHDLRTPLTVVAGYIEAMQEGVLEADPERLTVIYGEITQLQRLVEDLMTLSRADAGELRLNLQSLPVNGLLEQTKASFAVQAGKSNIDLNVIAGDDLPEVTIDESRMLQVLGNLVSNALRFTSDGGSITLASDQQDGEVLISVRDTGKGIPPDDLPHIFERLYRADSSRNNDSGESGLGLSISRAIVQAHGGRIWAESQPGEGATIWIALPGNQK